MTEDEAKTKWCPFVRVYTDHQNESKFDNRDFEHGNCDTNCIASDCMAWRYTHPFANCPADEANDGYCGLAGKP